MMGYFSSAQNVPVDESVRHVEKQKDTAQIYQLTATRYDSFVRNDEFLMGMLLLRRYWVRQADVCSRSSHINDEKWLLAMPKLSLLQL